MASKIPELELTSESTVGLKDRKHYYNTKSNCFIGVKILIGLKQHLKELFCTLSVSLF